MSTSARSVGPIRAMAFLLMSAMIAGGKLRAAGIWSVVASQRLPIRLVRPSGVAVDSKGSLYVADASPGRVLKRDAAGTWTEVATTTSMPGGTIPPGEVFMPAALAVDGADNLYVADHVYNDFYG